MVYAVQGSGRSEPEAMKQVEIISIRTSIPYEEQARLYLKELHQNIQGSSKVDIQLYANADIPGDLAVILCWPSNAYRNRKSDLGLTLSDALRNFGLVDHTCWLMIGNLTPETHAHSRRRPSHDQQDSGRRGRTKRDGKSVTRGLNGSGGY